MEVILEFDFYMKHHSEMAQELTLYNASKSDCDKRSSSRAPF